MDQPGDDDPDADDQHHDQRRNDEQLNDEAGRRRLDRRQHVVAAGSAGFGGRGGIRLVGAELGRFVGSWEVGHRQIMRLTEWRALQFPARTGPSSTGRKSRRVSAVRLASPLARVCENDAMHRLPLTLDTPAENLALDEALLDAAEAAGPDGGVPADLGIAGADRGAGPLVAGRGGSRRGRVRSARHPDPAPLERRRGDRGRAGLPDVRGRAELRPPAGSARHSRVARLRARPAGRGAAAARAEAVARAGTSDLVLAERR